MNGESGMMRNLRCENSLRWIASCLLSACLLGAGSGHWGTAFCFGAEPAAARPDRTQIVAWVEQLDSDQFVAREMATLKLIEAGAPVVRPVVSALEGESLEVTTRGIYVLRELALSSEVDVQDAAQTALEQVAASNSVAAARRAADTLDALAGIRQERAITELRGLGARISATVRQFGFQQTQMTEIAIDQNWRGKPQDLRRLKWLTNVQQISFEGEQVTDAFFEFVGDMDGLSSIVVKRTSVTERGLARLKGLDSLRLLDVKYSPIGDAALETLQQLKQLAMVKLYGTQMTPAAAEQLQAALPQAEVDFRRGAFLGVACDQPPMPCTVVQVVANTAAARAGLLEGDVIIEYGGKKIVDFNSLKKLIGTHKPGDSVDLRVARGGSIVRRILRGGGKEIGVSKGESTPLGLQVKEVAKGSTAAQLGIRQGDVIRRFDERPVDSVDALNAAFKALGDDQQAFMELSRDMRIIKAKVTFGEWE